MVPNPTNAPSSVGGWHTVEVNYYQENYYLKVYVFESQKEYSCVRLYSEDWTEWVQTPTCTPPQEFDLPLAEGLQPVPAYGSNKYRKNQFNEVGITISVTKTDIDTNDIENSSLLATLPAGFRPATIVSGAAFVDRGAESVVYPACIVIYPDGSVIMNQSNGVSCSMVIASMSFLAAG